VIGCDVDLDVLAMARDNARAAKVDITWQRTDIARLTPEMIATIAREKQHDGTTGVLLANPPYGERLGDDYLYPLYTAMAHTCKKFVGWRAGFLVGNPLLEQAFYDVLGEPRIKKPLANANLRAYFYLYDL
jgi:23S rRNA G2445 N2-methylase RlmL